MFRIVGEKRPKMEQIKTLESFMTQQRDRKNFVEHDDLKVLEQHLAEYLTFQTDGHKDKDLQNVRSQVATRSHSNHLLCSKYFGL